ncbi:hypothetical protein BC828DRAFT_436000 [Blastocladiella britannica]|nr:hypothetical protein BC828DRAFT_436000 [Blastocladiella britannica]
MSKPIYPAVDVTAPVPATGPILSASSSAAMDNKSPYPMDHGPQPSAPPSSTGAWSANPNGYTVLPNATPAAVEAGIGSSGDAPTKRTRGFRRGITYANCSTDAPKSIETGTLDLSKIAGGTIYLGGYDDSVGGTYTISAPSASTTTSSNTTLSYTVTKYTSRSNPDPITAGIDGSTWTLRPWGEKNIWFWARSLRFDFSGLCTKTDVSIVLPDGSAALTSKMTLKISTDNAGVKLSGPGHAWNKVDVSTTNGGIRTPDDAKLSIGSDLEVNSTNGGIELGSVNLADKAQVSLDTTNGGITLGAVPASATSQFSIKLDSTNGGVTVKMPSDSSFTYKLSTTNGGKIVMGAKGASNGVYGDAKLAQGRDIKIDTTNGGVTIASL